MKTLLVLVIVVLGCAYTRGEEPNLFLVDAGLYLKDDAGEIQSGHEGLLVVHFAESPNTDDWWMSGTVCDDSFNSHAANLTCQYLGFRYAETWGSCSSRTYIPESDLEEKDIQILIDEVECGEEDTRITDCRANILEEHDCGRSENVWLECAGPEWQLHSAHLVRWNDQTQSLNEGREGFLLVRLTDGTEQGDEPAPFGSVCDDYFDDHAANLSCQYLGHKFAEAWGSEPENFEFVPEEIVEQYVPIVIDDVQCDSWATTIGDCEARILQETDCERSEALWLRCSSGDEEDGDEDESQALDLDFGGAKVTMNLDKFQRKWNF